MSLSLIYVLTAKPKKPTKEERIAEKKAKRRAEEKTVEPESKPKTAEEVLEEKLKQQRLQEESDLAMAMETFSVKHKLIDTMEPKSEEEFIEFQEALTTKITKFEVSVKVSSSKCFDDHYHEGMCDDPLPVDTLLITSDSIADFATLCKIGRKADHIHMQGL